MQFHGNLNKFHFVTFLALLQYYAGFLWQFGFFGADFFSHMVLQARAVFEYFHTA